MRTRREPPPFRRVAVRRVEPLSPRLVRITLAGADLTGMAVDLPAASVRLLLPSPGEPEPGAPSVAGAPGPLVIPTWRGNEFLLPDGRRPTIRTLTPRRLDPEALELDLDVVLHGSGRASAWAAAAQAGDEGALSGPGRGYAIDRDAQSFLVAGDETAIPAISQLLEALPPEAAVRVLIEVASPDARLTLPEHPRAEVRWCDLPPGAPPGDALLAAIGDAGADLTGSTPVWVAGEAAGVQRIRRYLFEELGVSRSQATVRGYWKHGRSGDTDDEA